MVKKKAAKRTGRKIGGKAGGYAGSVGMGAATVLPNVPSILMPDIT